jgi:hypothetical protein
MERALYAPGLGYYSGGARKFGRRADDGSDFVTAPSCRRCSRRRSRIRSRTRSRRAARVA